MNDKIQEELDFLMETTREEMQKAIKHLETELSHVRAGRANVSMVEMVRVDYYGVLSPLNQVSNVSTPDARTIAIQPWEKKMLGDIEKAILAANIGLTPVNNGELIRLILPPLTEERRKELVKQIKHMGENTKVTIRSARKDANIELKKLLKNALTSEIDSREMFMKGIDYSYYYEEN